MQSLENTWVPKEVKLEAARIVAPESVPEIGHWMAEIGQGEFEFAGMPRGAR